MTIREILESTTRVFRVGPAVSINGQSAEPGDLEKVFTGDAIPRGVVEVFDYPATSEAPVHLNLFDCVFVKVGVDPVKAIAAREDLLVWLREYPDRERLLGGPSYVEFAPVAGIEQETAFRVFALMAQLGFADIMTLRSVDPDASDEDVRKMAGMGMVYLIPKSRLKEVLEQRPLAETEAAGQFGDR
jgi:hypothetical protein